MKKYTKVTDMQVLKKYYEMQSKYYGIGVWLDYVSMDFIAKEMKTSKYQIRKAYKSLKEQGYMRLEPFPTLTEEYDNGLYTQTVVILHTKVYTLTDDGIKKAKEIDYVG